MCYCLYTVLATGMVKRIKMIIETEKYKEALEKYLSDGVNWDACNNEAIKTSYKSETTRGDVE